MGSRIRFWKQMRGLLSTIASSAGLMPTANLGTGTANNTTFLRGDQTYATAIVGSTGSNDNRILRSDGAGGLTVQSSVPVLDDIGNLTAVVGLVAGSGSFAVTTAFDVLAWQGAKLGFASAAVGLGALTTPAGAINQIAAGPTTMAYVAGSDGKYQGKLPASVDLDLSKQYTLEINATANGHVARRSIPVTLVDRTT